MNIADGKVVAMSYVLKNSEGEELDRAESSDPFYYLHGSQQIVPGLESQLNGIKAGDKKTVKVSARDGYGEVIPELRLSVNRSQFPADMDLEVGMEFSADVGLGHPTRFRVAEVEGDNIKIDGNHPLAGEDLVFEVEIHQVREATKEEMEHGHAHGPHGHHHHS